MELTRVNVAGGDIVCAYAGPTKGPALLLLHGWTLDHRMWAPQLAAFKNDHLVLASDRRGFGQSTAAPDLAREADDVLALLDHFGVGRVSLLGMSQAGRVALDFAVQYGARLSSLILQGAPANAVTPGPEPDETIPIVEYAALVRDGRIEDMRGRWREHPLMRIHDPTARLAANRILNTYTGRDLGAASYLRDLETQDLAGIAAPALVITGALDTPWRRRAGDHLARALAQAQRLEIADAGHLCNLDAPEAFNMALRDFLNRAAA